MPAHLKRGNIVKMVAFQGIHQKHKEEILSKYPFFQENTHPKRYTIMHFSNIVERVILNIKVATPSVLRQNLTK